MSKGKDASDIVVLEQDLLNLSECFVYRIPPMRSAEGHRAEDWNLPSPLATCALKAIRRDNSLLVKLLASRPKENGPPGSTEQYLFAQSTVTFSMKNENNNNHEIHTIFAQHLDHSITNVVDSSRYFVIRIQNEQTKREASVGVGFRERDDATNFKMACMEFVKIMAREYKVLHNITESQFDSYTEASNNDSTLPSSLNTKLSLKEGEKIHVSIPIKSGSKEIKDEIDIQHQHKHKQSDYKKKNKVLIGKGGLFLKKPPPPPSPVKNDEKNATSEDGKEEEVKNDSEGKEDNEAQNASSDGVDDDAPSSSNEENEKAVEDDKDNGESNQETPQNDDDDDDDDEWGDFESG